MSKIFRWLRPGDPQVKIIIEASNAEWFFNTVAAARRWAEANKNYWPLTIYDENGEYVTCYTQE